MLPLIHQQSVQCPRPEQQRPVLPKPTNAAFLLPSPLQIPPDGVKQKLMVKQLLYRSLQLFASVAYDTLQCSQVPAVEGTVAGTRGGWDPRGAG